MSVTDFMRALRRIAIFAAAVLSCTGLQARKPNQPEMRFRPDGTFKIVQFTDTHIRTSLPDEAQKVYDRMDYVVETEKPDMIVLTGDIVTVKPAAPEWQRLISKLDSYRIPWCAVFGNHDAEQDLTRAEMSALIAAGKYSLNTLNKGKELADVEIPVAASSTASSTSDAKGNSFYVFCMDSHADATLDGKGCYDWFSPAQVQWLRDRCSGRTAEDGIVAQSLAFFHIPLREYIDAWADHDDPREGTWTSAKTLGIRGECICCAELNTGMFAAMKESGSVVGMSVGHDHDNDFAAAYHGIAMCYGRYSGANTVTNHLPGGARIFLMKEGVRGFESWIREDDGRVLWHMAFDGEKIIRAPRDRAKAFGTWFEVPSAN